MRDLSIKRGPRGWGDAPHAPGGDVRAAGVRAGQPPRGARAAVAALELDDDVRGGRGGPGGRQGSQFTSWLQASLSSLKRKDKEASCSFCSAHYSYLIQGPAQTRKQTGRSAGTGARRPDQGPARAGGRGTPRPRGPGGGGPNGY